MKRDSKIQMRALLTEWKQIGLSPVEFCRIKSIGVSTFQNWLKKENKFIEHHPPAFSFGEVVKEATASSYQSRILRLITSYGLLLEIPL
ncbi:MAG: hypothetical protein EOP04_00725 [Proteobacteria bacterium]|nr:MAG: hypothetical protein EOP04_00725 [Pseudomonadota bacterium]